MSARIVTILSFSVAGLVSIAPETVMAQAEGVCCQYSAGILEACPVTTEVGCDDDGGTFDGFVWIEGGTPCDPGGASTGSCSFSLPVELTAFSALAIDRSTILLEWATASETNNAGFDVEMEIGTGIFTPIGFVDGHGTVSEPRSYSFRAVDLDPGSYVFRLRQVDFDGSFEYSSIAEAALEIPGGFVLEEAYPNPFNPSTTIRFGVSAESHIRLALYDAGGRFVRVLFDAASPGNTMREVRIDGSNLSSGTYHVQLEGEGVTASRSITLLK